MGQNNAPLSGDPGYRGAYGIYETPADAALADATQKNDALFDEFCDSQWKNRHCVWPPQRRPWAACVAEISGIEAIRAHNPPDRWPAWTREDAIKAYVLQERFFTEGSHLPNSPFVLGKTAEDDAAQAERVAVEKQRAQAAAEAEARARRDREEYETRLAAEKAAAEQRTQEEAERKRLAEEKAAAERQRAEAEAEAARAAAAERLRRDAPGLVYFAWTDRALDEARDRLSAAENEPDYDDDRDARKESERAVREAIRCVADSFVAAQACMEKANRILTTLGFVTSYDQGRVERRTGAVHPPMLLALGVSASASDSDGTAQHSGPAAIPKMLSKRGAWSGMVGHQTPDKNFLELLRGTAVGDPIRIDFNSAGFYTTIPVTPAFHLLADMPLKEWLDRMRLGHSFADFDAAMARFGNDPALAAASLARKVPKRGAAPCAIDGLLLNDALTLLGGAAGKGKSTFLTDLAHAIASGASEFLRFPISESVRGKTVAFLFAEDRFDVVTRRLDRLDSARGSGADVLAFAASQHTLDAALDIVRNVPDLGLVIVDPALPWFGTAAGGMDENDNPKMGAMLEKFVQLAAAKNCPVLLSHHLGAARLVKGEPSTPDEVYLSIRGAQAFRDRPRCVWTLHREGDETVLGIAKSNDQESVPLSAWRLGFDADTGMFARLGEWEKPGRSGRKRPASSTPSGKNADTAASVAATPPEAASDAATMAAAVARLVAAGQRVTKTGDCDPHKHAQCAKPPVPELAGWGRARCREAVVAAVAAGLLVSDQGGAVRPADPPTALAAE